MASYISSIKNWFKAGYEGRHLELILLEIAKMRPEVIAGYLSKVLGVKASTLTGARYQVEIPFQGQRSVRRADIGVFREGEIEPIILIEIKYFDKPLPENLSRAEQLDDYLYWKQQGNGRRHVLVLSREMYHADGLVLRRWDHLARALRNSAGKSDLIRMLVDYLQEEGIVMQNVDSSALQRYFIRLVCHDRNVGRAADNLDGPIEFARLLRNLQMLSGAFTPKFKKAWGDAGEHIDGVAPRSKVASIDFRVRNKLRDTSDPTKYRDQDGELPGDLKDGGFIDIFATHSLGHFNEYLRIEYGMSFFVPGSNGNKTTKKLKSTLFVNAYGKKISSVFSADEIGHTLVTDKAESYSERVESYLQEFLLKVITEVLDAKAGLNAKQKKAMRLLKKSLYTEEAPELADAA
jgi:hypothetical protein